MLSNISPASSTFPRGKDINAIINDFTKKNEPIAVQIESLTLINNQLNENRDVSSGKSKVTHCIAMHDFEGSATSDLTIKKGETIALINTDGEWWKGEVHGKTGYFPATYVKID